MKKLNKKTMVTWFCGLMFLLLFQPFAGAQKKLDDSKSQCDSEISPEQYKSYWRDKTRNEAEYARGRSNEPFVVPVRLIGLRRTNGTGTRFPNSVATVNQVIDILNEDYAGTNVSFEHCGEPIFIDSDYYYENFRNLGDVQWGPEDHEKGSRWDYEIALELAYFSSDANAYSPMASLGANNANFPCVPNNPVDCTTTAEPDNILRFRNINSFTIAAHEFGHHLGVLHPEIGAEFYNIEVQNHVLDINWSLDHPYGGTVRSRELIIRDDDDDAPFFTTANCDNAADFCCDTPVTGSAIQDASNSAAIWPAPGFPNCCDSMYYDPVCCASITPGIFRLSASEGCVQFGPYEDYNGQKFEDQPGMEELARNIMSALTIGECELDQFTQDQIDRMHRFHEMRRSDQYELDLCLNHKDFVNFWAGPEKMNEISIQNRHAANSKYANTFTNTHGEFSSILYDENLTSKVRKLGLEGLDGYLAKDWRQGINVTDLVILARGNIGLETLNGYQKLSGDVDNDGTNSGFDLIEIQKLILWIIDEFPNHEAPWKFIPEYIPNQYVTAFNANPFVMTIDGVATNGMPIYTEESWTYSIADGNNGLAGFDGYKLGDINKSSTNGLVAAPCNEVTIDVIDVQIPQNQIVDIEISIKNDVLLQGIELDFILHPDVVVQEVSSKFSSFSQAANYNIRSNKGVENMKLLWFDGYGKPTQNGKSEFKISVSASSSILLSELISINENNSPIIVSDFPNCSNQIAMEISVNVENDEFQSREIMELVGMTVYPNPAKDNFQINMLNKTTKSTSVVELVDIAGKKVVSFDSNEKIINVPTRQLSAGIYQLMVKTDGQVLTEKIVIE